MPAEDDAAAEELTEIEEEKEAQVLDREPLETELMDEGHSEEGEAIERVEDE
ncbi:MAG: hypothetical protein ACR2HY_04870 [Acidimicrobiales bacterium]